jgi:hypothetical protein
MEYQNFLTAHSAELERPGEASRQLWSYLVESRLWPGPPGRERGRGEKGGPEETIALSLPGRYLLRDGSEFPCRALDISPSGIAMRGVAGGHEGDWIITNFRALGRIEGVMARKTGINFVMDIDATPVGLERLARKIGWHIRRQRGELPERRKHERVERGQRKSTLRTLDGQEITGELLDDSAGGAAVQLGEAALYLWIGQPVTLDGRPGSVLRYFPGGIVLRFDEPSHPESVDPETE